MKIESRHCPKIDRPCQTPPEFAPGQKQVFCSGCQKPVHNLAALTRQEQSDLLSQGKELCVRYRRLLPIAVVLLSSSVVASEALPATQSKETEGVQIQHELMLGSVVDPSSILEPIFIESEVEESFDENPV